VSALAAAAAATAGARERASTILLYRDDGPLSRMVGRALAARVGLPAPLLVLAGALPLAAVLGLAGDDSPVALGACVAWLVLLGGISSGRRHTGRAEWTAVPLVRLAEYGSLLWFAALAGGAAVPACFAFLCAAAFRHYDAVYRLRHQGSAAADWVRNLGGGWDGRVLLGYVLLVTGAAAVGLYAAAVLLAVASVAESVASWLRHSRAQRPAMYADEEAEEE
jgi:hypothetical protein